MSNSDPHPTGKQVVHQAALELAELGEGGFLGADAGRVDKESFRNLDLLVASHWNW